VLAVALPLAVLVVVAPVYFSTDANSRAWDTPTVTLARVAALVLVSGAWFGRGRGGFAVVGAATLCVSVAVAALSFGGPWSWWHIGFGYGTHHYQTLYMGPSVNNLAALLRDVYHWDLYDVVFTTSLPPALAAKLPADYVNAGRLVVTIKLLLTSLFVAALPLCAWGLSRHARRNDPRFLIAAVAPWVIFFAVMPQMHERYLFWAAVIGVACLGASSGGFFLYLTVSLMSLGMILQCQLPGDPNAYLRYPAWLDTTLQNARNILVGAHPGLGWAMLLIAATFLYLAVAPSRRPRFHRRAATVEPHAQIG
jgi:hypothetical protein